jgi:hypothetical protein
MAAMRRLWLLLPAAAALAACRGGEKDPVLARVGRLAITQSEFQRKIADVSPGYQDYVLTPNGRRQFLDVLIREKLVLAAAQHSDVPRSAEFLSRLEQLRRDEEDRVRDGSEALLTTMWIEDLRRGGELKVSDAEVRDFLDKHPTEVVIRHVLLGGADKAALVAKKLRSGANFAKVAQEESLDATTAAKGGEFPPLMYGEVIPELEDIVFRMRVGGYHVVRKDGEKPLDKSSEETRERVERLLEKQKLDRHLQQVEEKFPVEVVDEQFK